MPTVLSSEVSPAAYAPNPEVYHPDQIIAELAGMSVREMVEINQEHYSGIKTEKFELPVKVGNDAVMAYRGWNDVRIEGRNTAPRGGTRMYWSGDPNETGQLADGMDTKLGIHQDLLEKVGVVDPEIEIPVGGKSEIVLPVDPRRLSPTGKAEIITAFVQEMDGRDFFLGRGHRTGPDMNMDAQNMALMRDVLISNGHSNRMASSWITGKAIDADGVAGRKEATARGGAIVLDEYLKQLEVPEGTKVRFSLHGYGNAGSPLVDQFNEVSSYGGVLACVTDQYGSLYSPRGIDTDKFKEILFQRDKEGDTVYLGVCKAGVIYRNEVDHEVEVVGSAENPDYWLEVPADCYVPASVAGSINMRNVHKLIKGTEIGSTKFVASLANHGVETPAQYELEKQGIRTLHHAHFNSHGVTASLVESHFAVGGFKGHDRTNPATVYEVIDFVARNKTRELFSLSNEGTLSPTASLAVAVEALRLQVLKQRLA